MARSWQTAGLLLLGGLGCIGVGMMFGSGYQLDKEPLWREPSGPAIRVETTLPSFRDLVQRVESSVVSVQVTMPMPEIAPVKAAEDVGTMTFETAMQAEPDTKSGSGFISNSDGLIVTSRHVVLGAETIEVYLPNHGGFDADLVGQDPATDLAMLRLVHPPKNLPALMIGDSKKVAAGDWIVAVGNPYGFSRTVTAGLVSYVGRHLRHDDLGVSRDFLQISAQINPGSSGCPVFDVQGRVVGVSTQFASSAQGISFAVPSRTVKWALEKMRAQPDGTVRRGYLGIEFAPRGGVTENGEPMPGAVIVEVVKGDPAEKAGLQRGDVVLGVNGTPILAPKDLHECIVCSDPGTSIALQLLRDDQICDPIVAVLGEVGRHGPSSTTN